jgi:hypothetical protein
MYLYFITYGILIIDGIKIYEKLCIFQFVFHAKKVVFLRYTQQIYSVLNYINGFTNSKISCINICFFFMR